MKKLLLCLFVLATLIVVASCGKDNDGENSVVETPVPSEPTVVPPSGPTVVPPSTPTPVESEIQKILDEAANLGDKETLSGDRTVTGTVKEITDAYSDQYKNISFILTDGVADILVFRSKGDCAASLKVGDTVTVTGQVINYSGTIEFQYAALTADNGGGTLEGFVSIQSILDEAASLGDGQTLEGNRKTVGTVKEIKDAYSSQYKNITFILTDGTADILVFRAKGNCAANLKVGDKVYVDGEVINYGGTIEFQYAALTTDNDNVPTVPAELMTVAQVLEAASGLADGAALPNDVKASGVVSNFEKKFSYSGGDYYQFYLVDGDSKVLVYKPQGAIVETLQNGETVYVKGLVKNYKGTIEFDSAVVSYADDFDKSYVEKLTDEEKTPVIPSEVTGTYDFISLPHAIAIARDGGEDFQASEKHYITGWVKDVSNYSYGSITITDGNVTIFAYGLTDFIKDGQWPLVGDIVVIEAVIGTKGADIELKNASKLVEWHKGTVNVAEYEELSIGGVRGSNAGDKVITEGTVVAFTYKNAKTSSGEYVRDGLYIIHNGYSIYVYGSSIASAVEIGNTIKLAGVKNYYVLESEASLAEKYGYAGAGQIEDAILLENDGQVTEIAAKSYQTKTVKELLETPFNQAYTLGLIYKVRAIIKKVPGQGFVNYYINDLDGVTGTYTYTKCNGNDFAWIDKYLDQNGEYFCELLVTLHNAKSTASGCNWRFMPIAILGDASFDVAKEGTQFVFNYIANPQFEKVYYANPNIELITSYTNERLGLQNVTIRYVSNDESVCKIDVVDGKTYLNVVGIGSTSLEIHVERSGYSTMGWATITREGEPTFDALTVKEAIETPQDQEVVVMGIVAGGVANQKTGFYLIDETGVIAVKMLDADQLAKIGQGNKVVIKGMREQYKETETLPGQTSIVDAELVHNYYGEHEYSTATFQESTLLAISQYPATTDYTTQVYIIEASYFAQGYNVLLQNGQDSIALYCSGAGQYSWLAQYATGQILKMEVALCNWNNKTDYKAYVLAVYLADGTKVVNPTNFAS